MISPEELRRYPFFSFMNHEQLREMAMITDEVEVRAGEAIFHMDEQADAWYLLKSGGVNLHFVVVDETNPDRRKEFTVGSVNPGEALGIPAVVEPYVYTTTAVAGEDTLLLRADGQALRELCEADPGFAYGLQRQVAKALLDRLNVTRIQLAAANGPD
jgi:CRP/FNR family transcriptional regulator, cyclic AMP receptor protein